MAKKSPAKEPKERKPEGLLERKIYFYKVDAGQIKEEPVQFDPVPILQHISGLPFKIIPDDPLLQHRYLRAEGDNLIYVEPYSLEFPQKLVMGLSRRTNLPELERLGALSALPIPDGAGLSEKTHIMFFGEYVAADFNFYGPRVSKLSEYFGVKAKGIGRRIRLDHLIRREAAEDLKRLSGIVLARFKFQKPAMPTIEKAGRSLGAGFREMLRVSGSDEMEVVLRKKKGKFLSKEIFSAVLRLAADSRTYEEFTKLRVEGDNRETEAREEVNILNDQLILTRRTLRTDAKSRAVKTESAFIEIESAFHEVSKRLGSAVAAR